MGAHCITYTIVYKPIWVKIKRVWSRGGEIVRADQSDINLISWFLPLYLDFEILRLKFHLYDYSSNND